MVNRAFLFVLMLIATVTLSSGCGDLLTFNATVPVPEQTVKPATTGALGSLLPVEILPPISMNVKSSQAFKKRDVDHVESLRLTKMTLSLTGDSTQRNFDFLDSMTVSAKAKNSNAEVRVAAIDPVPDGLETLNLAVTENQLVDVVGTDFEMIVEVVGRFPQEEAKFDGAAVFKVEGSVN